MGGFDVFCPFCGVLAKKHHRLDEDTFEPCLVEEGGFDWMADVRLVGFNDQSQTLEKLFLTGPARFWDYGFYDVEPSDDPNFPLHEPSDADGMRRLRTYDRDDPMLAFPLHLVCFEDLFSRVLHWACSALDDTGEHGAWNNINLEMLHASLSAFRIGKYDRHLSIDYGHVSDDKFEQYVQYNAGDEHMAEDPASAFDLLGSYFSQPPRVKLEDESDNSSGQSLLSVANPLSLLPQEILEQILLHLSVVEVQNLRGSCRSLHNRPLGSWYWYTRVVVDFPFLNKMPHRALDDIPNNVDWSQVYKDVAGMSTYRSKTSSPSLINRRRIWFACEQIVDEYLERVDLPQSSKQSALSLRKKVLSPRMPLVAWPNCSAFRSFRVFYTDEYHNIPEKAFVLVQFNNLRLLANISVAVNGRAINIVSDAAVESIHDEFFVLNDGEWIERMELVLATIKIEQEAKRGGVIGVIFHTTMSNEHRIGITEPSDDGASVVELPLFRRILKVSDGSHMVGLQGESANGAIHRLGILESVSVSKPAAAIDALEGVQRHMWHIETPRSEMLLGDLEVGYWSHDFVSDTSAMRHGLAFDYEPGQLNYIAGDVLMGGFERGSCTRDGIVYSVGPRFRAMKKLAIDGKNGERVVLMGTHTGSLPQCVRFVTNTGRQLVLGWPDQEAATKWHRPPTGHALAGVFGTWDYSERSELATIGAMFSPAERSAANDSPISGLADATAGQDFVSSLSDADGRLWEPMPPPNGWCDEGEVIRPADGTASVGNIAGIPLRGSLITWLDFSRSLKSMKLWFSHPFGVFDLSIVGMVLDYEDGTRSSAGVESLDGGEDAQTFNDQKWRCPCRSYSRNVPDDQWPSPDCHWYAKSWSTRGRISLIRTWRDKVLEGIQFVTDSGRESPIWGRATGLLKELRFEENGAQGLKVFLGSNHRHVSDVVDMVVLGFQAMKYNRH